MGLGDFYLVFDTLVVCANLNGLRTSNLYIIIFKKEDTILSNNFQHIKASIKDLIKIYNNDFSANN